MIHFNNHQHGEEICEAAGTLFHPQNAVISRTIDGELAGGVVYQEYTGSAVSMHVAGFMPFWMNKTLLWIFFDYPFNQLGCKKVFGLVPSTNHKALEFDRKIGFKEETRLSDAIPDGDMIVLSMYREDCRWLKIKPELLHEVT